MNRVTCLDNVTRESVITQDILLENMCASKQMKRQQPKIWKIKAFTQLNWIVTHMPLGFLQYNVKLS